MIIGTVRPEEAKVFDQHAGYHQFTNEDGEKFGSVEIFWAEKNIRPGWYWWACQPGCLPDDVRMYGPFASSTLARRDADPDGEW